MVCERVSDSTPHSGLSYIHDFTSRPLRIAPLILLYVGHLHRSTNANLLKEKGIGIWNGNGSREFLDKLGFSQR